MCRFPAQLSPIFTSTIQCYWSDIVGFHCCSLIRSGFSTVGHFATARFADDTIVDRISKPCDWDYRTDHPRIVSLSVFHMHRRTHDEQAWSLKPSSRRPGCNDLSSPYILIRRAAMPMVKRDLDGRMINLLEFCRMLIHRDRVHVASRLRNFSSMDRRRQW